MDEDTKEVVEETNENAHEAEDYEAGQGNQILDSLYSQDLGEVPPEQEPTEVPVVEDSHPGDTPVSSVAMSLEDALVDLADSEEETPETEAAKPEPKPEPAEEAPKKEDLDSESQDYFDDIEKEFTPATAQAESYQPVSAVAGMDLTDEEKDEYELTLWAGANDEKLKDLPDRMVEFHRKKAAFMEKATQDDSMFEASMDNMEYAEFISKNRPKFSELQKRNAERAMDRHEILSKTDERVAQAEARARAAQTAPMVQQRVAKFYNELTEVTIPDDIKEAVQKDGLEAVRASRQFEVPVIEEALQLAHHFGSTFLALSNGLVSYDKNNPAHAEVSEFVDTQGRAFAKQGGKDRFRDKKKFVPRSDFHKLSAEKRKEYWTFSDNEVLDMVKFYVKDQVNGQLEQVRGSLESYKTGKPPPAAKQHQPVAEEPEAPKARPTKSTGATTSMTEEPSTAHPVLGVLGL